MNTLDYSNPLGNVHFDFLFNGKKVSNIKPSKTKIIDETLISYWEFDECHVEFLRSNFIPKIPSSMKVEQCIAGIWIIKNFCEGLTPTFKIHLNSAIEGCPETGEGLISQFFENEAIKLSIGTEDEDYLSARARQKKWMPSRFQNILDSNTVEYIPGGLQMSLPKLEQTTRMSSDSLYHCLVSKKIY